MPDAEPVIDGARTAGVAWGIAPESVEVISRSENVVCRVVLADGRPAVLRLHRPGYNTLDQLRSEVAWVQSMADAGLDVPLPVPTLDGRHYVTVDIAGLPHHVGVIEWVTGEPLGSPLGPRSRPAPARYRQVGRLAAQIRSHSVRWQPPAGFDRRRWDADGLVGPNPLWGRFWEAPNLTTQQREVFSEARDHLVTRLGGLSTEPDRFGLIHADLHLGNLMADGELLTVIDFDDAGFGWFAYELAVALHPVLTEAELPTLTDAIVEGYRTVHPLSDDERRDIDVFLVMRSLMIVGWLSARPEVPIYRHFDRLATTAEALATHYLGSGSLVGWAAT